MKKRLWASLLALTFAASLVLPQHVAKAEDVVKLEVHMIGGEPTGLADVTAAINEKLAPHGLAVNYHYHDWGVFGDDTSRILNSGEAWDLMFAASIKGYEEYAQNGQFAYLNDLLEETPKLKEYIPQTLWDGVSYKGQIFGVPALKDSAAAQYWIMDVAVADKLGIDIKSLKTLEDLDAILPQIKEAIKDEPDRYPIIVDNDGIDVLLCDYEYDKKPYNVKFGTDKAINLYEQPDILERYEMIRKWQEAGYINPDANQKTPDQLVPGKEVLASGQGWDGAEVIWSNRAGHPVDISLRYGPILTGESIRGSFMVVNQNSDHKVEALKYLELVNTDPEIRNLLAYGREGKEYEVVKEAQGSDGKTVTFEPVDGVDNVIRKLGEKDGEGKVHNGYDVPAYSQGGFEFLHVWLNEKAPEQTDPTQYKTVVSQNENAEASKILGFIFDQSEVESEIAVLNGIVEKYYANLTTGLGDKPVKEMLADMNKELKDAGIDHVLEVMQRQIDEYKASLAK